MECLTKPYDWLRKPRNRDGVERTAVPPRRSHITHHRFRMDRAARLRELRAAGAALRCSRSVTRKAVAA